MKKLITGAAAVAAVALLILMVMPARKASAQTSIFAVRDGSSIGVSVRETTAEDAKSAKLTQPAGVVVESVLSSSPAEKAGFRTGDIVVEFDGERIRSVQHFTRIVRETAPRRTVNAVVVRGTGRQTLEVTPEAGGDLTLDLRNGPRLRLRDDQLRSFDFDRNFNFNFGPDLLRRGLGRPSLGVTLTPLSTQLAEYFGVKEGALVSWVDSGSPAADAGVRAGDVITAVNGRTVSDVSDVTNAIRQVEPGAGVDISVTRDRKQLMLKATIPGTRPLTPSGRGGVPI
jgi:serine protease Do